jgi:hypothetical protein
MQLMLLLILWPWLLIPLLSQLQDRQLMHSQLPGTLPALHPAAHWQLL